jgi:hypothetical protein
MVALDAEDQLVTNITQAIDDLVLTEPAGVNRYQAARRLRALGSANEIGTPECVLIPATPVHGLITNWLGFTGADINAFWSALSSANTAGHLDLILCAITKAFAPLATAIKAPPVPGFGAGVTNVDDLAAKNNGKFTRITAPIQQ